VRTKKRTNNRYVLAVDFEWRKTVDLFRSAKLTNWTLWWLRAAVGLFHSYLPNPAADEKENE
jgi:hypothetical protein